MSQSNVSESQKKRKKESKFDANTLRSLIKEGKTAKEIMSIMNISHKQILKHHLMKLISLDSQYYEIVGLYGQNNRKAYVNSKGVIVIKNNMIDFGDLNLIPEVTQFDVEVDDANGRIILTVTNFNVSNDSEEDDSSDEYVENFADEDQ